MGEGFQSEKITLSTNIWALYVQPPFKGITGGDWGFRVRTGVGEGFQVTKSHCRQTYGFICTATL